MAKTFVDQAMLFENSGNISLALEQYERALALLPGQVSVTNQITRIKNLLKVQEAPGTPSFQATNNVHCAHIF